MKYNPIFLRTENELNKIIKRQRKTKYDFGILYVSLWDKHSQTLVDAIKKKLSNPAPNKRTKPLYIVDSFTMPHAFVIFKTTKLPHLVQFNRNGMESEDYLSKVYYDLGV
jgi:hypothetical protein